MEKQGILISREKAMFIVFLILGLIAAFFRTAYMLPLSDSFVWFVGVFICFYVPGNLLQRLLKWKEQEYFAALAHSIALGVALVPVVYTIFRILALPWLLYLFLGGLLFIWTIIMIRDWPRREKPQTNLNDLLAIFVLGVFVLVLLQLSYFTDIVYTERGMLMRHTNLNESIFHLGIINVLKNVYPPYFPYASGVSFGHYHLNMHLEIEMFSRLFRIDTIRLAYFYFPLLYFCLLVYLPYLFVRRYLGSRLVGVVTGLLIFGSDLSFIPGVLGMLPQDGPWNNLFNSTIWPLLTLNGFLPAVIVMFLCILHLKEYFVEGKTEDLFIFAVLGFAGYGFKSSMGPHIMAAAFLTGLLLTLRNDRQKGKKIVLFSLISMFVMVADIVLLRGGAGTHSVSFSLMERFRESLDYLGFPHPPITVLLLALPITFVAVLGARVISIPDVMKGFQRESFDPTIVFLLFFVAAGYIFSEMFFLGSVVSADIKSNNAMWFSFEALTAAWLLVSCRLARIEMDPDKFWQATSLVLILSLPGTIEFLSLRHIRNYDVVSPNALKVVSFLETIPPDAVILHAPNMKSASLASNLAGRQTVVSIYQSFVWHNAGQAESEQRLKDIENFFDDNGKDNRLIILKKYGVTYVYALLSYAQEFDKEHMMTPVLKNSEFVVYKVAKVSDGGMRDWKRLKIQ